MGNRIFIIHGWEGSPEGIWLPWIKRELEDQGNEVITPAMPDAAHPDMQAWLGHLHSIVGTPDEDTYFVGHSLGCVTILRYLESLPPEEKVGGAVLVAGFTSDLGYPELHSFFTAPIDWAKITSHGARFVAIHSDNDYYVSLHYGDIFKKELDAELIIEHDAHHFGGKTKELFVLKDTLRKLTE